LTESSENILEVLPLVFKSLDSQDLSIQENAEKLERKLRECESKNVSDAILGFNQGLLHQPNALHVIA